VRWIRSKSIAEHLFGPSQSKADLNTIICRWLGGTLATRLNLSRGKSKAITSVEIQSIKTKEVTVIDDADAVVLAVGAKGAQISDVSITRMQPCGTRAGCRCFLSVQSMSFQRVCGWIAISPMAYPANVFSRFESLKGAGGTFFMLDQLQKDSEAALWGDEQPQGFGDCQRLLQRLCHCSDEGSRDH